MEIVKDGDLIEEYSHRFPLTEFFTFDIQPYTSIVKFETEESILTEGRKSPYLYYLLEGRAKLFLSHENGRVSLINFLDAPCFIGEMELIGAQEVPSGVTAVTPCLCYAIHLQDCKNEILSDIKFLRELCLFLGQKALDNTRNYSKNQSYPLEVRLADFILKTANQNIYRERHTEAAEFLGVTYRHFLYVLADFKDRGILDKTEQGYLIQDREKLLEIAKPIL